MKLNMTDAHKLLASRIDDHLKTADRGELVCSNFLTPAEAAFALLYLKELKVSDRAALFGGYHGAERRRLVILPSYLSDIDGNAEDKLRIYFSEETANLVRAVKISGSEYRHLYHRDYLGALLSLGIERHALGDVAVLDEYTAIVFCTEKIHAFLLANIDRIASDKVTCSDFVPDANFTVKREFLPIYDTVASNRFDCVVSALANISREKAQSMIRSGVCELDHLPETRCDTDINTPCTVTLHGYGKYNVLSFEGETKRGRLRLVAQKYV